MIEARELISDEKLAYSSHIGQHQEGKSLVDFLSGRFSYFTADQWVEEIYTRDVLVNGMFSFPGHWLRRGDEVRYMAKRRPEPKVPTEIEVLFEDEDLLIVNKPPHIPVHPTGRYLRNTLISVLQSQRKNTLLVLSHRLDRETSGVCVLTKTRLAKDKIYWQFFKNEIKKTYWALVWGCPKSKYGTIDVPLGAAPPGASRIRIKQVPNGLNAKTATTKYEVLGTKWVHHPSWQPPRWASLEKMMSKAPMPASWPVSLIEARPVTGRTNQIRVHLATLECGVLGDKLYDPDPEEWVFTEFKDQVPVLSGDKGPEFVRLSPKLKQRLVLDAHALHAKKLEFRHPRSGKMMVVKAPVPRSWQGLYNS